MRLLFVAFCLVVGLSATVRADDHCLVVADLQSGTEVMRDGAICDERIGPASTFKFVLAIIGYDAGILVDANNPSWPYRERYAASRAVDRQTTTPSRWMAESVLWYSREIVAALGAEGFAGYITRLGYGNADVTGDPGAGNGMTHSWLNSSLQVSPVEQMQFVRRAVLGELPVSRAAMDKALGILPVFPAGDGWVLLGKTGTGYVKEANGKRGNRQFGWFIGWAMNTDGRALVFSTLYRNDKSGGSALGPRVRDDLVARWAALMAKN